MGLPSFFKINKPRRFNFYPRYYDERKEKLQERIKKAEEELGIKSETSNIRTLQKGAMRGYFPRTKRVRRTSNIRLIIIIVILLLISYYLFFY